MYFTAICPAISLKTLAMWLGSVFINIKCIHYLTYRDVINLKFNKLASHDLGKYLLKIKCVYQSLKTIKTQAKGKKNKTSNYFTHLSQSGNLPNGNISEFLNYIQIRKVWYISHQMSLHLRMNLLIGSRKLIMYRVYSQSCFPQ